MNEKLALRILGVIMGWSDAEATEEFHWLRLISRVKYDGYQDYLAGARFIERLADWVQQFRTHEERGAAYAFVRAHVVYIGPAEMLRLVELLYPGEIQRTLLRAVARALGIPPYRVWASAEATTAYEQLLRRTLFIGLSDGARLDLFRRANAGVISNEQIVVAAHIDEEKWDDLLKNLRKAPGQAPDARFSLVYLIDDFVGTGTTFIRKDSESGAWKGKLAKFHKTVRDYRRDSPFEPSVGVCVHHYIANHDAVDKLRARQAQALVDLSPDHWFQDVRFSFGTILPRDLPITRSNSTGPQEFVDLAKRYYDPELESRHTGEGGTDMRLGFAACALPLILEHNTPNNTVSLLWAETDGDGEGAHAMRPLFRRRQRHS